MPPKNKRKEHTKEQQHTSQTNFIFSSPEPQTMDLKALKRRVKELNDGLTEINKRKAAIEDELTGLRTVTTKACENFHKTLKDVKKSRE
jgi:septation ring formation regulator EzrA